MVAVPHFCNQLISGGVSSWMRVCIEGMVALVGEAMAGKLRLHDQTSCGQNMLWGGACTRWRPQHTCGLHLSSKRDQSICPSLYSDHAGGGTVHVFSGMHASGEQLNQVRRMLSVS